jgi:hypothetical protein
MEEWLKRLIEEHKQLVDRMVKLSTALHRGLVPKAQVAVLEKRAYAMMGYEQILRERLIEADALSVSAGVNPEFPWCNICCGPINGKGQCNCTYNVEVTYHPYLWRNEDGTESTI